MRQAILVIAAVIAVLMAAAEFKSLTDENRRLKGNQETLLSEKKVAMSQSQSYKISDSLNAAEITGLRLSLSEYKKYRSQDLELIKSLKIDKSDLRRAVSAQTETNRKLSVRLKDSIRVDTIINVIDTVKCFRYTSKWTDVTGCIDPKRDTAELRIVNRESLKIVESVKYKRFLGFLWKTNKIKSRQMHIVSQNPFTTIIDADYVSIEP